MKISVFLSSWWPTKALILRWSCCCCFFHRQGVSKKTQIEGRLRWRLHFYPLFDEYVFFVFFHSYTRAKGFQSRPVSKAYKIACRLHFWPTLWLMSNFLSSFSQTHVVPKVTHSLIDVSFLSTFNYEYIKVDWRVKLHADCIFWPTPRKFIWYFAAPLLIYR